MYAKIFASLYQGTLRGDANGLLVFTNLLAHADAAGCVDIHPRAVAQEVGISIDQVRAALLVLEAPDGESRSPDHEGRRLIRLDEHRAWGWKIVNHAKYRAIRSEEDRREQNRASQARFREKSKPDSKQNQPASAEDQPPSAQSAQAEAYTEAYTEAQAQAKGEKQRLRAPARIRAPARTRTALPPDFGISPAVTAWAAGKGYGDIDAHLESFRAKCAANGYGYSDWDAAFRNAIADDWAGLRSPRNQRGRNGSGNASGGTPQANFDAAKRIIFGVDGGKVIHESD